MFRWQASWNPLPCVRLTDAFKHSKFDSCCKKTEISLSSFPPDTRVAQWVIVYQYKILYDSHVLLGCAVGLFCKFVQLTIEWLTPGAVCVYMLDKCDRFYYLNLFWRHCCRVISRAGLTGWVFSASVFHASHCCTVVVSKCCQILLLCSYHDTVITM